MFLGRRRTAARDGFAEPSMTLLSLSLTYTCTLHTHTCSYPHLRTHFSVLVIRLDILYELRRLLQERSRAEGVSPSTAWQGREASFLLFLFLLPLFSPSIFEVLFFIFLFHFPFSGLVCLFSFFVSSFSAFPLFYSRFSAFSSSS